MKLGIIITQTDPETVFNTLRLAEYSLQQGDEVRIFLSGKGVGSAASGSSTSGSRRRWCWMRAASSSPAGPV